MTRILLAVIWGWLLQALPAPAHPAARADAVASDIAAPGPVRIGVLAYRGKNHALQRWSPTADYLSSTLGGYRFEIVPLDLDEIEQAVGSGAVHFTLTNPGNYVDLETRFGISRIATLQSREGGLTRTRYGAVIVSRADNPEIQSLADLKGKSFMAVSTDAFGGFQMAWRELQAQGIDPFSDFSRLEFAGFPQDRIITAVHTAQVDAATVRVETLTRMLEAGQVDPGSLQILASTRLYPEWPFATLRKTDRELATDVARALLAMPKNHPAASASHTAGWTVPLDYSPVHELMKSLKIGPYKLLQHPSLGALIRRHMHWFAAAGIVLIALILLNGYVSRTNRRLKETERYLRKEILEHQRSQEALAEYRDTLEQQVAARTDDLQATNMALEKSRVALRELVRISSAPELSHDEKLTRLLDTGRNYYGLPVAVLASIDSDQHRVCKISGDPNLIPPQAGNLNQRCAAQLVENHGDPLDIPDLTAVPGTESCLRQGWRTYLGAAVLVEGNVHYTLEFAGTAVRDSVLSKWDKELLKVMAQWIGDELERQIACEAQQQHQNDLARVSRMSTIGEMAAGLAHELNQPLTGAINYSSGCLRRLRSGEFDIGKLIEGMERSVEGATLAADIIRHIREFVQKGDSRYSPVDLNKAVRNVAGLLMPEARRHGISIDLDLVENLPLVEGNMIQLEQVLLNLMRNAIDALETAERDERRLTLATRLQDGHVRVIATDTGDGIDEKDLPRVFDAFYSTKSDGIGIGLSISRSIIESHHGQVMARSLPGGGAELSFELPVPATQEG